MQVRHRTGVNRRERRGELVIIRLSEVLVGPSKILATLTTSMALLPRRALVPRKSRSRTFFLDRAGFSMLDNQCGSGGQSERSGRAWVDRRNWRWLPPRMQLPAAGPLSRRSRVASCSATTRLVPKAIVIAHGCASRLRRTNRLGPTMPLKSLPCQPRNHAERRSQTYKQEQ
jgi:hypothetical protein